MGRSNRSTSNAKTNGGSRKQKVVCGVCMTSRGKREKYAYRAKKKEKESRPEKSLQLSGNGGVFP